MAITDLTNTIWHIPSGWTAEAGYGQFYVDWTTCGREGWFVEFFIGYYYLGDIREKENSICEIDLCYSWDNNNDMTITITGGRDVTNPKLIAWLEANGTKVEITDLTYTTWYIPSGWNTSGDCRGEFDITCILDGSDYGYSGHDRLGIGYSTGGSYDAIISMDSIAIYYSDDASMGITIKSTSDFIITFTGGNDVTNRKLIAWLVAFGELQDVEQKAISGVWQFNRSIIFHKSKDIYDKVKFSVSLISPLDGNLYVCHASKIRIVNYIRHIEGYYEYSIPSFPPESSPYVGWHRIYEEDKGGWLIDECGTGIDIFDFGTEPQYISADLYDFIMINAKKKEKEVIKHTVQQMPYSEVIKKLKKTAEAVNQSKVEAIAEANSYTDNSKSEAISEANSYTDDRKAEAISEAISGANRYTDTVKDNLLNGAGSAYDTLKELADLIVNNRTALDALREIASGKANAVHNHSASDINSGALSTDRLPVVPISKGGTGSTSASGAISALGAVPTTRRINGTQLTSDINLNASSVGADAMGSANRALSDAKKYADEVRQGAINEAGSYTDSQINKAVSDVDAYIEEKIKGKLDKSTIGSRLYGTKSDKTQTVYVLDKNATKNSVPQRDADGDIRALDIPIKDNGVTSKKYVDTKYNSIKKDQDILAQKVDNLETATLTHIEKSETSFEISVPQDTGSYAFIKSIQGRVEEVSGRNLISPDMVSFYSYGTGSALDFEYDEFEGIYRVTLNYSEGLSAYATFPFEMFSPGRYIYIIEGADSVSVDEWEYGGLGLRLDLPEGPEYGDQWYADSATFELKIMIALESDSDTVEFEEAPADEKFEPYHKLLKEIGCKSIHSMDGLDVIDRIDIPERFWSMHDFQILEWRYDENENIRVYLCDPSNHENEEDVTHLFTELKNSLKVVQGGTIQFIAFQQQGMAVSATVQFVTRKR